VKRVLVTGATGFVGRQALPFLLERGFEVHGVGRGKASGRQAPGLAGALDERVKLHECDLLDSQARQALLQKVAPSHLLHLAWVTEHGKFWTAPENQDWVQASWALAREFAGQGGRRAVFAGTCAEYEWAGERLTEDRTPLRPATLYGRSKNELREKLAADPLLSGLSWAWGRIFFLYGPFEAPGRLVSSVILSLLAGKPARCSDGEQLRDLLHVADVAAGFVTLLDSGFDSRLGSGLSGAVNIACGEELPIKQVVTRIAEKLGRTQWLELGAIARSAHDPARIAADATRLRGLGWAPRYTLESGLDDTIAWWRGVDRAAKNE
jgi:nucleoside-diphosphate-sugar epimerase